MENARSSIITKKRKLKDQSWRTKIIWFPDLQIIVIKRVFYGYKNEQTSKYIWVQKYINTHKYTTDFWQSYKGNSAEKECTF